MSGHGNTRSPTDPQTGVPAPETSATSTARLDANRIRRHRSELALPSLGRYLRQLRESQRDSRTGRPLSREKAAHRIGLSAAYLVQVENGVRNPTAHALGLLANAYGLSPAQTRHIRELRDPPTPVVGLSELRVRISRIPVVGERLDSLNRAQILAAYFDPFWSVLAANDLLYQAFPGLADTGNLAVWYFGPTAPRVLVDWEPEATHMVAWLKSTLGQHRNALAAQRLLMQLGQAEQFWRLWTSGTDIAYRRDPGEGLRLRNSTGEVSRIDIETSEVPDTVGYIRLYQGISQHAG